MKFLLLALLTISCVTTPKTKEEVYIEKQTEVFYQEALAFNLSFDIHFTCVEPKIHNNTDEPISERHTEIYKTLASDKCLTVFEGHLPCPKEIYKFKPFDVTKPSDGLEAFCVGPK